MSVSKWRYTEACDGRPCVGDCDLCSFDPDDPLTGLGREIPKGEWEEEHLASTYGGTYTVQRCSRCQCAVPSTPNYNFCPNCGADMRGDTE